MINRLHSFNWRNVLGCLVAILVFGNELFRHYTLFPIAKILALALVLFKYYADFPAQLVFSRQARAQGKSMIHCLLLLLPTFITGFASLTLSMLGSLFNFNYQNKERITGIELTYLDKGSYATALLIALIACMVDVPVSAFVIQFVAVDPVLRMRAHAVLFAITLYCILIILADKKLVRSTVHEIGSDQIRLRLGKRFHANIPLDFVEYVEEVREPERLWCNRKRVQWYETIKVTPFDQPNAVIVLKDGAAIECDSYGVHSLLPKYVFLYLDQPSVLIKNTVKKEDGASSGNLGTAYSAGGTIGVST